MKINLNNQNSILRPTDSAKTNLNMTEQKMPTYTPESKTSSIETVLRSSPAFVSALTTPYESLKTSHDKKKKIVVSQSASKQYKKINDLESEEDYKGFTYDYNI